MATAYFDNKGVKYTTKDITQDADAFHYVVDKIGQAATPVIDIDGITVLGFDRPKIDEALRAKHLV